MTADLHGRWAYYQWLAEQNVDLIVIAGDLINNLAIDESEIILATHALAGFRSPVAVCSGNHDHPNCWFPILEHAGVLSDGQSKVIGNLLVTSLPFEEEENGSNDLILHEGRKRVGQHTWIVINHDPPFGTQVGGPLVSTRILRQIRHYRPDYLVSGHWHDQPYKGSWYCAVGQTICFNAGQPEKAMTKRPNCIYLDTSTRQLVWINTSMIGSASVKLKLDQFSNPKKYSARFRRVNRSNLYEH